MINQQKKDNIINIIDGIFQQSASLLLQHQDLINRISPSKKLSAESLLFFSSFIKSKKLLSDSCQSIGLSFYNSKPENIKKDLFNLKAFLENEDILLSKYDNSEVLKTNIENFFDKKQKTEHPYLMVNLQDEAEFDTDYLVKLLNADISLFRVNCAYGNHKSWENTITNFNTAKENSEKEGRIMFDLAGQKIRIKSLEIKNDLQKGSKFLITNVNFHTSKLSNEYKDSSIIESNLKEEFTSCHIGDIIRLNDSMLITKITNVLSNAIVCEIINDADITRSLSIGKGINFPDSSFSSTGLTEKDKSDLQLIIRNKQMVSFSFAHSSQDINNLYQEITKETDTLHSVVIKIETCKAVDNLQEIFLAAMQFPVVAIMVARGDLVSECGWKALPEVQEKIYNYARSAHLPVILATEILEQFNIKGTPTRAGIIDLHHANKFDCLLLNKGKNLFKVIEFVKFD